MRDELHLAGRGLAALLILVVAGLPVAWFVGEASGVMSMLVAVSIVGGNHLLAALSTGWARWLTPNVVTLAFATLFIRAALVLGTLGAVMSLPWIHASLFAVSFVGALTATLGIECLSYARKSYVPRWRLTA